MLLLALLVGACDGGATRSSREQPPPGPPWELAGEEPLRSGRLAAGRSHACLVDDRGTVWCWGSNKEGQLGDGTTELRDRAVRVRGVRDVVGVAMGGNTSCAWRRDGTVACWGAGWSSRPSPGEVIAIDGLRDVVEVVVADLGEIGCARMRGGTVSCWSVYEEGRPEPVLEVTQTTRIAAVDRTGCALSRDERIRCWDLTWQTAALDDDSSEVPGAIDLALLSPLGYPVFCARIRAGNLVCPGRVSGITDAVALSGSGSHFCVLHRSGRVSCWGTNESGELGVDPRTDLGFWAGPEWQANRAPEPRPVRVAALPRARAIAAGGSFSCAVTGAEVRCWGERTRIPPARPSHLSYVQGIDDAEEIAADADTTCARRAEGRVSCWGRVNSRLESAPVDRLSSGALRLLGPECVRRAGGAACWQHHGEAGERLVEEPLPPDAEIVLANDRHRALCHRRPGMAWSCPPDMGLPERFASRPTIRLGPPHSGSARDGYGCAADGRRVDCWTRHGAFDFTVAAPVTELHYGSSNACALADGRASCWRTSHTAGVRSARAPGPIAGLAMGGEGACGNLVDGRVVCWSISPTREHWAVSPPELIDGLDHAVQVVMGDDHACARLDDGRVACWGDPRYRGDGEGWFVGPTTIR